jgi:hypothetical protein
MTPRDEPSALIDWNSFIKKCNSMALPRPIWILLAITAMGIGCRTVNVTVTSEAELFLQKNPEIRSRYVRLSPIDVDTLKETAFLDRETWRGAFGFVEKRVDLNANELTAKELKASKDITEKMFEAEIKTADELKEAQQKHGGQLYYFSYYEPLRDGTKGFSFEYVPIWVFGLGTNSRL